MSCPTSSGKAGGAAAAPAPSVSNLLAGDGAGGFADSGIAPDSIPAAPIRASGRLLGYTTAVGPAVVDIVFGGVWDPGDAQTYNIALSGPGRDFKFNTSDPADGSFWIDSTSLTDQSAYASALVAAIGSDGSFGGLVTATSTTTSLANDTIHIVSTGTGSTQSIFATGTAGSPRDNLPRNASGTDNGGAVTEVQVVAPATGKLTRLGRIGLVSTAGLATDITISLKTAGPAYQDLATISSPGAGAVAEFGPTVANVGLWLSGAVTASLVARISGSTPTGGDATIWAIGVTQE